MYIPMQKLKKYLQNHQPHSYILLLFSITGFWAAFTISFEKFMILTNPLYTPGCSINIWIDCGKVMNSQYATMFGFPNSWLGLIGWPMAWLTVLYLLTHKQLSKVFMLIAMLITIPAVIISYIWTYLAFFEIGAVCPWCILSCVSATLVSATLIDLNRRQGFIKFPIKTFNTWAISLALWFGFWAFLLYIAILR
jgi:uncharacterized membrane protein